MTTCPCCGFKFEGDLGEGCASCGARPVGPPLARPEQEMPAYGPALFVAATGALLCLALLAATVSALFEQKQLSLGFWKLVSAAETAAWRLKWMVLPASLAGLYVNWRVRARMRREPARFVGHGAARAGVALTAGVVLAFAALIGVTVPERLRQRELARQAALDAQRHAVHRVLLEYNALYGSLPSAPEHLNRLPDPDGSVAAARTMLEAGAYVPEADIAALPRSAGKSRTKRGGAARVRTVAARSNSTDDVPGEQLSLTNYTFVLPGRDATLGTPDDLLIRDGRVDTRAPRAGR
ncbi:MAG TPA: hypothetical protein VGV38_01130, partial [Pyrinomonadaceae bacterium]|nr:hypothetical protein [Pyrinomonadaceae bacterium]